MTRALEGESADLVGDVFDLDRLVPDQVLEIGEVGLGRGQQELVVVVAEDDPVFDHEATVVTPKRVLGLARPAFADVPRQHSGQELLGVLPGDPVLVEGRGVEDTGRVPDGEVLELLRHLILVGDQIAGPMTPETGLVGRLDAGMEGGGLDDRSCPPGAAITLARCWTACAIRPERYCCPVRPATKGN